MTLLGLIVAAAVAYFAVAGIVGHVALGWALVALVRIVRGNVTSGPLARSHGSGVSPHRRSSPDA